MSEFYTKSGDTGTSGLLGSGRVPKNHPRLEAVGAIDEANAALGIARASSNRKETKEIILAIQRDLYYLMAEVSAAPENAQHFRVINEKRVNWLEEQTDQIGKKIQMPKEFIVPGDTQPGANLDLARTVIRRAERRVSGLYHNGDIENIVLLHYLNRLSSLCFILELWESTDKGSISMAKDGAG